MPTWLPILRRKGCSVLFYSYINHGYKDAYHQELLGIPSGINFHRYVDGWVVIDLDDSQRLQTAFARRLEEDGYAGFFLSQCRRVSDDLFAYGGHLRNRDFGHSRADELLIAFMTFSSLSIRAMPFLTTMVLLQDVVESRLREVLSRAWGLPADSDLLLAQMQAVMLEGTEVPLATKSVRDLLRIAEEVSESQPELRDRLMATEGPLPAAFAADWPGLAGQIDDHLDQYDFLGTDYYVGEPLSFGRVLEQIATLVRQHASRTAEPILVPDEPLTLDADDAEMLATARELHFLRQHRIEAMFKAGRDARSLLDEVGSRIGVSYSELLSLTFDEVQRSLTSGTLELPLDVLMERSRDYGVEIKDGHADIVTGERLDALRRELPSSEPRGRRLQGVTAFAGTCEARACVVDRLQDIGNAKAGEVLVAPMTSPYHVPAMTIAGAVVTDEGGILSHAAIVSRELRIPCIVGVTGATETIESGQGLRVDATPGVGTIELLAGRE